VDIGGPKINGCTASERPRPSSISCTGVLQARCFTPMMISPTNANMTAPGTAVSVARHRAGAGARTQEPVDECQARDRLCLAADLRDVVQGQQTVAAPVSAPVSASTGKAKSRAVVRIRGAAVGRACGERGAGERCCRSPVSETVRVEARGYAHAESAVKAEQSTRVMPLAAI
jgi:hypothetical protein